MKPSDEQIEIQARKYITGNYSISEDRMYDCFSAGFQACRDSEVKELESAIRADNSDFVKQAKIHKEEIDSLKAQNEMLVETINGVQNKISWLVNGSGMVSESVREAWNLNANALSKFGELQNEYLSHLKELRGEK